MSVYEFIKRFFFDDDLPGYRTKPTTTPFLTDKTEPRNGTFFLLHKTRNRTVILFFRRLGPETEPFFETFESPG